MTDTITSYLEADHHRLSALLAEADRDPARIDREAYAAFRAGLLRHIAIEEKILLRAVKAARGGSPHPKAHALRVEHAAITSLLVPSPDATLVAELRGLLAGHDAREEGPEGVYADCEAILGEASAGLLAEARAYPEVRVAPHFDGTPERPVYRTAREALAVAAKIAPPRSTAGLPLLRCEGGAHVIKVMEGRSDRTTVWS